MNDWFRSWHGAPTDPKWLLIGKRAGVAPGVVSAIVWALLDYASQHDDRGNVSDFDIETYSTFSGFDEKEVTSVIEALKAKKLIAGGRLSAWEKRQPKREDGSADRAKEWRERNRTQPNTKEHREDKSRIDKKDGGADAPTTPIKKDRRRATQISDDREPNHDLGLKANLSQSETELEFLKFRNHAKSKGRTCIDWDAAEQNWYFKAAEFMGRKPRPKDNSSTQAMVFVAADDPAFAAWDVHAGKKHAKNRNGGWYFPTRWPPGHKPQEAA